MTKENTLNKTLLTLWRGNNNSSALNDEEIDRVAKALFRLQRGLTGKRNLVGVNYMQDATTLGAYLLYYYPITHRQITLEFESILRKTKIREKDSIHILDVGAGPGPASMAIADCLIKHGVAESNISIDLIDESHKALTLAKNLLRKIHPHIELRAKVASLEAPKIQFDSNYNIIVASHVFNELWKEKSDALKNRATLLKKLSQHLCESGILLISEPALTETSRATLNLIAFIEDTKLRIISPCPDAINETHCCPIFLNGASEKTTCHASIASDFNANVLCLAKKAGLSREDVKMTFLALLKTTKQKERKEELRIVSDAMLNKSGRIRYLLCDGKKRFPISAKAESSHAKDLGFFRLQRYDTIELTHTEIRGEASNLSLGIGEGTQMKIHAFTLETKKGNAKLLQVRRQKRQICENFKLEISLAKARGQKQSPNYLP